MCVEQLGLYLKYMYMSLFLVVLMISVHPERGWLNVQDISYLLFMQQGRYTPPALPTL